MVVFSKGSSSSKSAVRLKSMLLTPLIAGRNVGTKDSTDAALEPKGNINIRIEMVSSTKITVNFFILSHLTVKFLAAFAV